MSADLPEWDIQQVVDMTWGELIELRYGKSLKDYKENSGLFPVFGTNGPIGYCEKPLCNYPSVIIGRKGAYRGVHFSKTPFFVIDTAYYIEPKLNINLRWAYYQLLTADINGLDSGSAIPSTRREDFYALPVKVPPRKSQDEIVRILDSINNKIHLNTQTNHTLESIAQTIFKSWFVDFEPVKAKMSVLAEGGNREQAELAAMSAISGKNEIELTQMQKENFESYSQLAETAALFPSAMVESELGEIPEGWEVKSISDISTFPNGKIDTNALSLSNYISTENMLENRGGVSDAASLPSTSTVPQFSPNQILISNIRPYFKKIWLARFSGGRSNDVLAFSAKESGNAEFLYNLLYQDSFFEFMTRTSKGAKMPRGDKNAISNWKFACAPIILRSYFSKEARSLYSKIQNANNQNIELAELRDSLLPKLLSGEIDLSEIQSEVA
jgi:type I restriction enzyme, S subunit